MPKSEYYFPLLYRRLLVSTTGWKDEEFGAYLRLLIHQFDNNNRISPDIEELKRIVPSIKKNWPLISKKFKADENGMLFNQVMSEVYNKVHTKKTENKLNGNLGGRPKKENQTVTENKPNGYENKTHTKDITKDKEKNTESRNTAPAREEVERVFIQQGGNKEMALKFFNDYEAIGWKKKGQSVINFSPLVGSYIVNWKENDANKQNGNSFKKTTEDYNYGGAPLKPLN